MNDYIKDILNQIHNPTPKASILPYDYYDADNNLIINHDSIGFLLELTPIVGVTENLNKQLSLLFDEMLPKNSMIQFMMISSSNIDDVINPWLKQYENADEILKNIANKRVHHLKNLSNTGMDAYRVKNYRLVVAYSKEAEYSKAIIAEIKNFEKSLVALFDSLKMNPKSLNVDDLMVLASNIIDPGSTATAAPYNPNTKISNQIAPLSPLIFNHDKIIHRDGFVTKIYAPAQTPVEFSIDAMINFLGDGARDYLQVAGQLILNYVIYNNISSKAESLLLNKGSDLVKQVDSFMNKFDSRLKREASEWAQIEKLNMQGKKLLSTCFTIALTAKSLEFASLEQNLISLYIMSGFKLRALNYFMLPGFLAILPFAGGVELFKLLHYFNLAKTTISTEPIALLPIHAEWRGNGAEGLLLAGRRGQIFSWSPYFGESNYNLCVIGESGSGKSVLLQDLVTNLIATDTRVFVLDIGRSFEKLAKLTNGDFIEFSIDSNISLNPFSNIIIQSEKEEADFLSLLLPVIAKMIAPKRGTTDIEDSIIAGVLQEVWGEYNLNADIDKIIEHLKRLNTDIASSIATMLFQYSKKGTYGRFFSGKSNISFKNRLTIIEFEHLREKKDLMSVIMQMLAVQIMTQIFASDRKQRFAILFDEAWFCLESFPELLANLACTIRKYNGSLIIGTQSVNDFFVNNHAKSILENAGWVTLLKQKKESIELLATTKRISFDDNQIALIKSLSVMPGKYAECLISSSNGYVVGRLILDPFSRILYSTSPKEFYAVNNLIKNGASVIDAINIVASNN